MAHEKRLLTLSKANFQLPLDAPLVATRKQ